MRPIRIISHTATSCLGSGLDGHYEALRDGRSGLRDNDYTQAPLATCIGRVDGLEDAVLPPALALWDCRNNRLAWQALGADGMSEAIAALARDWPAARLGIAVGTSTASIAESERAYRHLDAEGRFPPDLRRPQVHQPHSLGGFLQAALAWHGPCVTVSTACSSGAKAWAVAARWLAQDLCDAVLVGGCDTLCRSTLHGFASLALTSTQPCRPFDRERDGISIGEAAAFALLTRAGENGNEDAENTLYFSGYGESSDAHHMSAPHPEGTGARIAMADALRRAGLTPELVDYVNLHGTATRLNDEVEAVTVAAMFPASTRASSTKGWTGHTLGAAGALEASLSLIALERGLLPATLNCRDPDPACGPQLLTAHEWRGLRVALSNSFGFGGTNASLIVQRGRP